MGTRVWILTVDAAEAYFEQVLLREAVKLAEKEAILEEMKLAHKLAVFDSAASKEEIIEALAKHYKTWLVSKKAKHDTQSN